MKLTCYQLGENAPPLLPAPSERAWMEAGDRRAYRCLPLSIANASGWQICSPISFRAFWNGGPALSDIRFEVFDGKMPSANFISSHFGLGIITFAVGYLFQTEPGWALWVRGAPNHVKDGIQPLDGVVETEWLPFTFTMNWKFTRPGIIEFSKGEPFCFLFPFPHLQMDEIEPEIRLLKSNQALEKEHIAWVRHRHEFNQGLKAREENVVKQSWQRFYHKGEAPTGTAAPDTHLTRRRLKTPADRRGDHQPNSKDAAIEPGNTQKQE